MAPDPGAAPARQRIRGAATLRVLGALLRYPDCALRASLGEFGALLAQDRVLSRARQAQLGAFIDALAASDPLAAEMRYVDLFDRGRATSLYLFEHMHGDSRQRGPAMIDLGQMYAQAGLVLTQDELPDFLPVVVEFASTQPRPQARAFLDEIAHLLNAIHCALQQRGAAHAAVTGALLDLAGHRATDVEVAPEPPLDESWTEPAAFDGCSTHGQAAPGAPQPVHIVRTQRNPNRGAAS